MVIFLSAMFALFACVAGVAAAVYGPRQTAVLNIARAAPPLFTWRHRNSVRNDA